MVPIRSTRDAVTQTFRNNQGWNCKLKKALPKELLSKDPLRLRKDETVSGSVSNQI